MRHTSIFLTAFLGFCLLGWAFSPPARAGSIQDTIWTRYFSGDVDNIAFSADGTKLFTPAGDSIHILDAATGIALRSYHFGISYYQHYADSEQNCVYFSNVDSSFHKRSLSDEKELKVIYMPGSSLFSTCSYTPDARYAIITSNIPYRSGIDNHLPLGIGWRVVDMQSGEIRQHKEYPIKLNELGADIRKVYLDPTGDTAIVEVHRSYGDGQGHWSYADDIILYSVATGDSIGRYRLPFENTFQSPDGSRIAVLYNNLVTIVQAATGKKTGEITINSSSASFLSISNDGRYLGFSRYLSDEAMEIWDVTAKKIIWSNPQGAMGIVLSSDIHYFIAQYSSSLAAYQMKTVGTIESTNEAMRIVYPNPSTGEVTLRYQLPDEAEVSYTIFSVQGEVLHKEELGIQQSGEHVLVLPTRGFPSGAYLLGLVIGTNTYTYSFTITK